MTNQDFLPQFEESLALSKHDMPMGSEIVYSFREKKEPRAMSLLTPSLILHSNFDKKTNTPQSITMLSNAIPLPISTSFWEQLLNFCSSIQKKMGGRKKQKNPFCYYLISNYTIAYP